MDNVKDLPSKDCITESKLRQLRYDLEDWAHRRSDPDMDTAMDADYRYWDVKGWVDALSRK
jgi:hypothetical protein